jgi:hypothetical protein
MTSALPMGLYDDDKSKSKSPAIFKYLGSFGRSGISNKDLAKILADPFKAYTCFLLVFVCVYELAGGAFSKATYEDLIGYFSCTLEAYGLISILRKIKKNGSVSGISRNTFIMFGLTYSLRECETMIMSRNFRLTLNGTALEVLQITSLPLVANILWCIFKTYQKSFQEELDILDVKYLIPGCMLSAVLIHPTFMQGALYSYCWTASFYVDVLALLPQVVMMAKGTGKIEAPIANFVAATAFSRIVDLWFWYFRFDLGPQGWLFGFNYSGCLIVLMHFVSLGIVADFMYYYIRARIRSATLTEEAVLDIC